MSHKPPTTKTKHTLAILTLQRHKDGVWIERLVDAIRQNVKDTKDTTPSTACDASSPSPFISIEVVVLDNFLAKPFCVSSDNQQQQINDIDMATTNLYAAFSRWTGIVNRVSDAAQPWEVKATLAILQLAKTIYKIPIWNGPEAYSLCANKWCHHVLFHRAGLESPDTVAVQQQQQTEGNNDPSVAAAVKMLMAKQPTEKVELQYLVKPNAGGFGAGIEKRSATRMKDKNRSSESKQSIGIAPSNAPDYPDRFVLYQTYAPPKGGKIYRVWFLQGKIQCAVERTIDSNHDHDDNEHQSIEFTSGCAGGTCRLSDRNRKVKNRDENVDNERKASSVILK